MKTFSYHLHFLRNTRFLFRDSKWKSPAIRLSNIKKKYKWVPNYIPTSHPSGTKLSLDGRLGKNLKKEIGKTLDPWLRCVGGNSLTQKALMSPLFWRFPTRSYWGRLEISPQMLRSRQCISQVLLWRTHLYLTLTWVVCWKARLLGKVGTRRTRCCTTGHWLTKTTQEMHPSSPRPPIGMILALVLVTG